MTFTIPPTPTSSIASIVNKTSLEFALNVIRPILARSDVTELCINRPGEAFIETRNGWQREELPGATLIWCRSLAKLVANVTRQRINETRPLLSGSLPNGERIQIVLPPATTPDCVAITIRRPSESVWTLRDLSERGIFKTTRRATSGLDEIERHLIQLLEAQRFEDFLRLAVRSRKNIIVSGPTGSGKTTATKALIREIPAHERLITIEDAQELVLDGHPNHVRLLYSKDDQGLSQAGPKQLLESCLRMKPDRILLAELRSDEAWDYLRNVNSGHPGSITSVHASSAELAFEQLTLLVKQSHGGQALARADIKTLLYLLVDIVVQFSIEGHERFIQEIWYDPDRKHRAMAARG